LNDTLTTVISYLVEYLSQTVILMIALTIMIKFQSLQFNFLGILIAAAAASGLEMIPYVGHYLAVIVLYAVIAKVTGASLYPDTAYTVAVAYALMFAMNLFVLGSLMGNLGLARYHPTQSDFADEVEEEMVVATNAVAAAPSPASSREKAASSAAGPTSGPGDKTGQSKSFHETANKGATTFRANQSGGEGKD
jgi:hypothetical protein